MKMIIKSLVINQDLLISVVIFVPVFLFTQNFLLVLMVYFSLTFLLGPITFFLVTSLERKFPIYSPSNFNHPILILGGGHFPDHTFPSNQQLTLGALGRLTEGLRLFRCSTSKHLIMSGPSLADDFPSQAAIQSKVALELGRIPNENIIRLNDPVNTEDEVLAYKGIFSFLTPVVVTKAIHLPRAVLNFRKHGIDPIPAPCNFIFKNQSLALKDLIIPSFGNAQYLGESLKEIFGLIYFHVQFLKSDRSVPQKVTQ
jgi:uncharacterized SAM-binding protein YcdF (DUF218 family)